MYLSIHNRGDKVKNCSNLRLLLKECKLAENFWDSGPHDPQEFFNDIIKILHEDNSIQLVETFGKENDKSEEINTSKIVNTKRSFVKEINPITIITTNRLKLSSQINVEEITDFKEGEGFGENNKYKIKRFTDKYIYSPYIVFNAYRKHSLYGEEQVLDNIIIPELIINLGERQNFNLHSIVIYKENMNHYTCVFRCGKKWYEFDDMGNKIKEIATNYKDMLRWNESIVMKYGVQYHYIPDVNNMSRKEFLKQNNKLLK